MDASRAKRTAVNGGGRERGLIDLTRTTPPAPPFLGEEVRETLCDLGATFDLGDLVRKHRFGGTPDDREVAGLWLARSLGAAPDAARVLVTNGAQNAALLLLRSLVPPDGLSLTEALTYHGAQLIANTLGIEVQGVAMDRDGLIPDALEEICRRRRPEALYCMPTLQNPTAVTMPRERRLEIAAVARRYGLTIIEDDVYGLLPADAPAPIAALAPDVTWYVTGFGKCVAAGLRLGYAVGPDAAAASRVFERFRTMSTWFPAPFQAAVVAQWVRGGAAGRVLTAIRAEAVERQSLARSILGAAEMTACESALHVWLTLPASWTPVAFVEAARQCGVIIRSGELFAVDPAAAPRAVRVCTGSPGSREELACGLHELAQLLLVAAPRVSAAAQA